MAGGRDGWMVGWNDCGWKMINQKLACPRPSARSPSLRPLARLGEVHRASFNATRSDILAPSLSSPLLPPDIVPLLFRSFLSVAAADIFCRSKGPFYLNSRIYCSHSLRALLIAFALACLPARNREGCPAPPFHERRDTDYAMYRDFLPKTSIMI